MFANFNFCLTFAQILSVSIVSNRGNLVSVFLLYFSEYQLPGIVHENAQSRKLNYGKVFRIKKEKLFFPRQFRKCEEGLKILKNNLTQIRC